MFLYEELRRMNTLRIRRPQSVTNSSQEVSRLFCGYADIWREKVFVKKGESVMNDFKNLKIAVAGTGYVGLSIAALLSQHHQVKAVDIIPEKIALINERKSPIQDEYIEKFLAEKELNLTATLDVKDAYSDADFVVIVAPTNYDSSTQHFDTSAVENMFEPVMQYNPNAIMIINSTIPVGYTEIVRKSTEARISFSARNSCVNPRHSMTMSSRNFFGTKMDYDDRFLYQKWLT